MVDVQFSQVDKCSLRLFSGRAYTGIGVQTHDHKAKSIVHDSTIYFGSKADAAVVKQMYSSGCRAVTRLVAKASPSGYEKNPNLSPLGWPAEKKIQRTSFCCTDNGGTAL